MATEHDVATCVLDIAPAMRELIYLRKEVVRLRSEIHPPTADLTAILDGGPIAVRRDDDGRWSARIELGSDAGCTGVSGMDTGVAVFKEAVKHLAYLLGREWRRYDGEDDDE